jgi:hypothetical protein
MRAHTAARRRPYPGRIRGFQDPYDTKDNFLPISSVAPPSCRQAGSLYIADTGNNRIRRISPDGIITTMAGNGTQVIGEGSAIGDGGPATQASVSQPAGVAVGQDGSLYISDSNHFVIRRVGLDGIISTYAGTGAGGAGSDGVPATQASLNLPQGAAADWANPRPLLTTAVRPRPLSIATGSAFQPVHRRAGYLLRS